MSKDQKDLVMMVCAFAMLVVGSMTYCATKSVKTILQSE